MMPTCDWPSTSGGACGEPAFGFVDQESSHRPVCAIHAVVAERQGATVHKLNLIDHEKVPRKIPTQAERGFSRPPLPSRPPLREAFLDLATSLLLTAKEEVDKWRSRR